MRGRKPKPTHLKVLQGTSRKDRTNVDEPKFMKPKVMRPPPWLGAHGKKAFKVLSKMLTEAGILRISDRMALEILCAKYGEFMEATAIIESEGSHYVMPSGQKRVHPAIKIRSDAQIQLRQFMTEFGLTPSSRSRVSVIDVTGVQDPLEAFINRKNDQALYVRLVVAFSFSPMGEIF